MKVTLKLEVKLGPGLTREDLREVKSQLFDALGGVEAEAGLMDACEIHGLYDVDSITVQDVGVPR